MTYSPCILCVSTSPCISTPNLVGVGRIRAASSRTGELSIPLKQQDIQIPRWGVGEDGQTQMPISEALESIQATVPGLGFLSSRTLLGCPLPLSLQSSSSLQAGGLTASSKREMQVPCTVCRQSHNSRSNMGSCGSADFSPAVQFLGLSRGPTTQCNHIELLFPVDPQLGNG